MNDGFITVFIILIVAVTVYKIFSLKYHRGSKSKSAEFQHLLAQELADRDDKAVALEERIRVLEKIVTDNHRAPALSENNDNPDK